VIEWIKTASGESTLRFRGKFLASSIDPVKDGKVWASRQMSVLQGLRSVFVLGSGSGHHLIALKNLRPDLRVLALETNKELLEATRSQLRVALLGIELTYAKNLSELLLVPSVREALRSSYAVVLGPSATITDPDGYKTMAADLNGRTPLGFEAIAKLRAENAAAPATADIDGLLRDLTA
jgi:hypothetical protein